MIHISHFFYYLTSTYEFDWTRLRASYVWLNFEFEFEHWPIKFMNRSSIELIQLRRWATLTHPCDLRPVHKIKVLDSSCFTVSAFWFGFILSLWISFSLIKKNAPNPWLETWNPSPKQINGLTISSFVCVCVCVFFFFLFLNLTKIQNVFRLHLIYTLTWLACIISTFFNHFFISHTSY